MAHARIICQSIIALALSAPVLAQPVSVNRGTGQGYVFNHNGNCFLVLPEHVHARQTRLTIATTTPSTIGEASLVQTWAPALDLSLFVVAGLGQRCKDRFTDLVEDLSGLLQQETEAELVRVDAGGSELRDTVDIEAIDYSYLSVRLRDNDRSSEVYQGSSGAILRVGQAVAGIAVQSPNVGEAIILRMDEIVTQIRRKIVPYAAEPFIEPSDGGETAESLSCGSGNVAIASVSCTVEPISPDLACSSLIAGGEGLAVFPAGTQPRLIVDLASDEPIPLGEISLAATFDPAEYAVPQNIIIEVSAASGDPRWQRFGAADMSPLGKLTLSNGARPYARQVAVTLGSSWDVSLPTGLTCIAIR